MGPGSSQSQRRSAGRHPFHIEMRRKKRRGGHGSTSVVASQMAEPPPPAVLLKADHTRSFFFIFNCFWWFTCLVNRPPFSLRLKTAMGLHWRLSAVEAAVFRAATLARRLARATPLLDGWRLLPVVESPLGSGLGSGVRRSSSHPGPGRHLQPQLHTHKNTLQCLVWGGKINSFLFSLPLCQMTQIICAAVTQCLAETECMRGVYTLRRPRIYLVFLVATWTQGALVSNR